ncbi:hypothetical protein [Methylobacter sp. S3L5C]|uniref:hypothetical protein n=1 Tax=Methylobacter sp. S3L5C TaxID=2839024 RepID=UPI001FACCDFA|nr:hypothetical protein [Methylobacter sp. S3L5C]UOA10473.1 hypothetical protein KKZ03_09700 [Methylobacter sp. S3L5C]
MATLLPSLDELLVFNGLIRKATDEDSHLKFDIFTYDAILERYNHKKPVLGHKINDSKEQIVWLAFQTGLKTATQTAVHISVYHAYKIAVAGIGSALTPWFAVAEIASGYDTLMILYDIKDENNKRHCGDYTCSCGNCAKYIQYIIDKKEGKAIKTAIGVSTLGVSSIGTSFYSVGKSFQRGRPKEINCKGLIVSARKGCLKAIATIFLLVSDKESSIFSKTKKTVVTEKTIAILMAVDGWKRLKKTF